VFSADLMQEAASATLQLPVSESELRARGMGKMEVEFALTCGGPLDSDCSTWDHVVTLTADCSGGALGDEPGGAENELARWITSFRRGVGHFLTDATPLFKSVFAGADQDKPPTCTFKIQTEGEPWLATVNLRFTEGDGLPLQTLPVVYENTAVKFDSDAYNENRTFAFAAPAGGGRAVLSALVTGHGGCEFLPSAHFWRFGNGAALFSTTDAAGGSFMNAGSPFGCADRTHEGAVPNEHGTWCALIF
jgi:hypothetical protein